MVYAASVFPLSGIYGIGWLVVFVLHFKFTKKKKCKTSFVTCFSISILQSRNVLFLDFDFLSISKHKTCCSTGYMDQSVVTVKTCWCLFFQCWSCVYSRKVQLIEADWLIVLLPFYLFQIFFLFSFVGRLTSHFPFAFWSLEVGPD